jgi:hypothetical protein
LTTAQFTSVQQSVNEFLQQAREYEREHLTVLPAGAEPPQVAHAAHSHSDDVDAGGKLYEQRIQLRISTYPQEGQELLQGLMADMQAILGKERASYWLKLAEGTLGVAGGGLGQRERRLILSFDGGKYSVRQWNGGAVRNSAASRGIPALEIWWRPFVRKTADGFDLVQ